MGNILLCLFVSDLRCQVWPTPLNPECGGFPSVPKRQLQGRVPWPGEPLSVCCLSCRASTAARNSHGGVRRKICIYVIDGSRGKNVCKILTAWSSSSADRQLFSSCSSSLVRTPSFFRVWIAEWVFLEIELVNKNRQTRKTVLAMATQ